jgi:hypothetical protein
MSSNYNPPPGLPGRLDPVTPVLGQRNKFMPQAGGRLQVDLGGEIVSTHVEEVISRDVVVCKITSIVVDKSNHGYKTGMVVPVQRGFNGLSETWQVMSDRAIREAETIERVRREERERQEEINRERAAGPTGGGEPSGAPPHAIEEVPELPEASPSAPVISAEELAAPPAEPRRRKASGPRRR